MTAKFYTQEDLVKNAALAGISVKDFKELIDLQSKGVGVIGSNHAKTVFHRSHFLEELKTSGLTSVATQLAKDWDKPMEVNLGVAETLWSNPTVNEVKQEQHLDNTIDLVFRSNPDLTESNKIKVVECAYKACTFGLGQILGSEYSKVGYANVMDFVRDNYTSEDKQLMILAKYIKVVGGTTVGDIRANINNKIGLLPLIAGSANTDVGYIADVLKTQPNT